MSTSDAQHTIVDPDVLFFDKPPLAALSTKKMFSCGRSSKAPIQPSTSSSPLQDVGSRALKGEERLS
jgi:hypothetical protein